MNCFQDSAGKCHYKGVYFEPGEFVPAPVGECIKMKCEDSATNVLAFLTCPAYVQPVGCKKTEKDLTKPYPHCCPKTVCPEGGVTEATIELHL
ncbi:hypothetical protein ILUMI_13273 [Ignelater luminosus]|uniref:Single domain-containing protein n=1 Tax=Ignelater luminosus TaxID=2038154 RepID=A0A8K0D149_IGNLU|nr:hypothetical protein ILUMI_13273 [Ignelater luminosus]